MTTYNIQNKNKLVIKNKTKKKNEGNYKFKPKKHFENKCIKNKIYKNY